MRDSIAITSPCSAPLSRASTGGRGVHDDGEDLPAAYHRCRANALRGIPTDSAAGGPVPLRRVGRAGCVLRSGVHRIRMGEENGTGAAQTWDVVTRSTP